MKTINIDMCNGEFSYPTKLYYEKNGLGIHKRLIDVGWKGNRNVHESDQYNISHIKTSVCFAHSFKLLKDAKKWLEAFAALGDFDSYDTEDCLENMKPETKEALRAVYIESKKDT